VENKFTLHNFILRPSLCQKLSKLVKILKSYEKNNCDCFLNTVYYAIVARQLSTVPKGVYFMTVIDGMFVPDTAVLKEINEYAVPACTTLDSAVSCLNDAQMAQTIGLYTVVCFMTHDTSRKFSKSVLVQADL